MKKWYVVDIVTIASLVLILSPGTRCDDGKSKVKNDSHGHGTPSSAVTTLNATVSAVDGNSTKHPILSSREGVPKVPPRLPNVVSSSEKPSVDHVSQQTSQNGKADGIKINETAQPPAKDVHWTEGGGLHLHNVDASKHITSKAPDARLTSVEQDKHVVSARKGAVLHVDASSSPRPATLVHPSSVLTVASTTRPKKHKPLFTMVRGDKLSSGSESIIESSTTGKDYVFPLVLLIFAVPGTVFFIKFLYKRGTEFTERQQYHRMYLIDDEFRAPFWSRWKKRMVCFLSRGTGQRVNLMNLGDVGVTPRTNYNSF